MNTWQTLKQLRYLLRARNWTGSSTDVFGSVHVSVGPTEDAFRNLQYPLALIRPLAATVDPEHDEESDLIVQQVAVRLAVAVPDGIGEAALLGANRTAGSTSSKGRGLLEVEEELFAAIEFLDQLSGISNQCRARSAVDAQVTEAEYVVFRDYVFDLYVTADRYYHPATQFAGSDAGGGSASLSWTLPPDRYDRLRMILRRATGSTAPTSVTDGTGVSLSADLATSKTDTPGVGTWSYALFVAYDETHSTLSTEERYSSSATKTVTLA